MVSGFAMPKIWRQIAMDISVTAVKTGRRRYLTLIMIFITVVICYVDRANLAVASAHIQAGLIAFIPISKRRMK